MTPLELAVHDSIKDGQRLTTEYLIKCFSQTGNEIGFDTAMTISDIVIILNEHLKNLKEE